MLERMGAQFKEIVEITPLNVRRSLIPTFSPPGGEKETELACRSLTTGSYHTRRIEAVTLGGNGDRICRRHASARQRGCLSYGRGLSMRVEELWSADWQSAIQQAGSLALRLGCGLTANPKSLLHIRPYLRR